MPRGNLAFEMSKQASNAADFEKLGAFYLGREVDTETGETHPGPLLYDSKDLCTHAVIVGMTGSGKTGLGVGILEEAAIDGVPAIIVDPKGDMGNLALNFPQLRPEDFEPWVDEGAAQRAGKTVAEHAKFTSELWTKGIGKWGQDKQRVKRLRDAAQVKIWTPGSKTGNPITMLKSFDAPPQAVIDDAESLGDRVQATTAGLLSLIGVDPDPVKSREAILVANILQHCWSRGMSLGIGEMIGAIQSPPFEKLGVLDLETFYSKSDRSALAMRLNGLLASPGFAAWLEGEPLDIQSLLYAPDGRPRLSVLSISHLSDEERMSFVTVLLGEILSWVRTQPGTSSLRALLYMDEIYGYFPPTANPPSKKPMLTLLKQARAFGLGVILSTQNPVDLDYKGLSNCGTWFLGRLQTERDKLRVMDGLQGSLGEGGGLDRKTLEKMLSGMEKRTFLLHNVHEEKPALFQTRWVLSYLRGPLTRPEIERVTAKDKPDPATQKVVRVEAKLKAVAKEEAQAQASAKKTASFEAASLRPEVPDGITERFLPLADEPDESATVLYRPGLYVEAKAHYASSPMNLDEWVTYYCHSPIADEEPAVEWEEALVEEQEIFASRGGKRPRKGAQYGDLPSTAKRTTTWSRWHKGIKAEIYQSRSMQLYKDPVTKLKSEAEETQPAFRARTRQAHVEKRDLAVEKLRAKYKTKIERAEARIIKAHEKLGLQEEQLEEKSSNSWLSMGSSLLGALFSRKKVSATNMRRAGSAMKTRTKVAKEKQDVERAERELKEREEEMRELEATFEAAISDIDEVPDAKHIELTEVTVRARKSDFDLTPPVLLWTPWIVGDDGVARRG